MSIEWILIGGFGLVAVLIHVSTSEIISVLKEISQHVEESSERYLDQTAPPNEDAY